MNSRYGNKQHVPWTCAEVSSQVELPAVGVTLDPAHPCAIRATKAKSPGSVHSTAAEAGCSLFSGYKEGRVRNKREQMHISRYL